MSSICLVHMNVLQSLMKFHQCFFKILRKQNVTDTLSFGRTNIKREKSLSSNKHSLQGYNYDGQESPMLHTKFHGNRPAGSGDDF